MRTPNAQQRTQRLRELHIPGDPLVLVNVWDVASARVVAASPGTQALATASWSVSAALGFEDGGGMPLHVALDTFSRIVDATDLPVSADFEKGYADSIAGLQDNIRLLIATGAVGLNLEDSLGADDGALWSVDEAAQRIATVRGVANDEGVSLVINARTDVLAGGGSVEEAIFRGNAYVAAGADCIFVLGGIGPHLPRMTGEIAGPVSVLAGAGSPTVQELAEAGVARISVGPGSMGVAYSALAGLVEASQGAAGWPAETAFRP